MRTLVKCPKCGFKYVAKQQDRCLRPDCNPPPPQARVSPTLLKCKRCGKFAHREQGEYFSSERIFKGFICGTCAANKEPKKEKAETRKLSPAEEEAREALKTFGHPFIREFEIKGVFFDFCIPDMQVLIEVDGFTTHRGARKSRDVVKNRIAAAAGYELLRFKSQRGLGDKIFKALLAVEVS